MIKKELPICQIGDDKWYCALKLSLSGPSDVLLKSTCNKLSNLEDSGLTKEGRESQPSQVIKVYNSFESCLQNCNLDEALSNYLTPLLLAYYTTASKERLAWLLKWKVVTAFQIEKTLHGMASNIALETKDFFTAQSCFWRDLQWIFASRSQCVKTFQDYKEELVRLIVERTLHDLRDIQNRNPTSRFY